jgi:hypothetical protein
MHKLSHQSGDAWVEHSHPLSFKSETANNGIERLVVGVPSGTPSIFQSLVDCLAPPYFVLYILHTPRGEGNAGRYQSSSLGSREFHSFLERYSPFLSRDSRLDLWAYSPTEKATVTWDRHNLIHAYGPINRFSSSLRALGFRNGMPNVSFPHQHHYHAEFDADAAGVLAEFDWHFSPLHPEDEQ